MSDFERELGAALRREEQELDSRLAARIAAARNGALSAVRPAWYQNLLVPALGAAALAGVLALPVLPAFENVVTGVDDQTAENVEFDQDLDFYLWLAEQDEGSHG